MKKSYVNPRCNNLNVVEQDFLLQTSTTPTGFVVGGEEADGPNVKASHYWEL